MKTEVIVVGAGPTGLMLAHELTLAGVPIVVLDKQLERSTQSRAGGLQPRTAEVLDLRGLLDPLLDRALPRGEFGGHFAGLPVELDCSGWNTRHPHPVGIPQARLEAHLEKLLLDRGVPVLRGVEVSAIEPGADTVTTGGIEGRYLVACDGGHSTVRKLLGAAFPGTAGTMSAVVADITLASRSSEVPTGAEHFSRYFRYAEGYFAVLHPIENGLYRFIFGKATPQGPDRDVPVTAEEVQQALHAVYGTETVLGELRVGSRFSNASRQLEHYRHGRVLFAGDAAHIHLPIGGQGVNLGIQDAVNLGWKLAATVHGWAPDGLLDTYHTERHPVAARVLRTTRAQGVIMNSMQNEDVAAVRELFTDLLRLPDANHAVAGMMSGLDIHYPGVGPRVIDLDLITADGPTRVSRLLHSGRPVLLELDGTRRSIDRWAGRVDQVTAKSDADSPTILIRPDGYIAWSATDDEPLETALTRWFG
ncbi:MAG: FAD-dependent monooxygenase [Nocardia sp.]|nr:FAD-dependent monooxygenase [Nocardia sp.]